VDGSSGEGHRADLGDTPAVGASPSSQLSPPQRPRGCKQWPRPQPPSAADRVPGSGPPIPVRPEHRGRTRLRHVSLLGPVALSWQLRLRRLSDLPEVTQPQVALPGPGYRSPRSQPLSPAHRAANVHPCQQDFSFLSRGDCSTFKPSQSPVSLAVPSSSHPRPGSPPPRSPRSTPSSHAGRAGPLSGTQAQACLAG
jgi:hypothetical protein